MKHRSLRPWLAALALTAVSASAQAELVRLQFDLSGRVGAITPLFAPLAPQGADFSASWGFDYDTSATVFTEGARWQTLSGQFRVGGLDVTGLGFSYASMSAGATLIGVDDGVGASYTDAQGERHVLDGFDFVMPVSGFSGTLAEVLAMNAGTVPALRLWGLTWATNGFGYRREVGTVDLSGFAVAVQSMAVPEPASLALVGLALLVLAGVPGPARRRVAAAVPD